MLILDAAMLQALEDHNDITYTVDITLAGHNSVDFTLTEDDLIARGSQITRAGGSDAFPLGHVYCTQLTLQIYRTPEREVVDFFNAKAVVRGVYSYDDQEYPFSLGTYYLIDNTKNGETIQIIGYDGVYAADMPATILKDRMPMLAKTAFEECCRYCSINFNADYVDEYGFASAPADWDDCDIMINSISDDTTYRQIMSAAIVLFGANAYISPFNNRMYVVPVKSQAPRVVRWGGNFDAGSPSYITGDDLDGGTFSPWNTGDSESDTFGGEADLITLDDPMSSPTIPLQNITVDGVKADSYLYPLSGGYLLNIDVSLFTQKQVIVNRVGSRVAGLTFRPFEMDYQSFPFVDLFQRVAFSDARGRTYESLITQIDIMLKGISTFKCEAETPARNNGLYKSVSGRIEAEASQARQAAAQAQEDAAEALSKVDGAMDEVGLEIVRMNSLIANSMGVFETIVTDSGGGKTYYLHNKQTMEDSDTIWKMTADGFAVSNDGGATWAAGIDAQGHAVVNVLSAIGIYADWIKSGRIISDNERAYWDLTTGVFSTSQPRVSDGLINNQIEQIILDQGRVTFKDLLYNGSTGKLQQETILGHLGTSYVMVPVPGTGGTSYTRRYVLALLGKNIAFSTTYSDDSAEVKEGAYAFYINSDTNGSSSPGNHKQVLLFLKTAYFQENVDFAKNVNAPYVIATEVTCDALTISAGARSMTIKGGTYSDTSATVYAKTFAAYQSVFVFADDSDAVVYETLSDVKGNRVYVIGDVRSSGAMKATAFQNISDERRKDVEEWDDRYDHVLDEIEPIRFRWKDKKDSADHIGVSAQKVLEALRSLGIIDSGIVSGSEESTYMVGYNELTTLLIRKVKQQQKKIDSLGQRIARLEKLLERA